MPMFVHLEIDLEAAANCALFLRRGRALARPRTVPRLVKQRLEEAA